MRKMIYLLCVKLHKVSILVENIKKIDRKLDQVTISKEERMILTHQREQYLTALKKLF